MLVPELVTAFLTHTRDTKSRATWTQYAKMLRPFIERFAAREFASLKPIDLDGYFAAVSRFPEGHKRAGEPKAPDTRRAYIVVFQVLQEYALSREIIRRKVAKKLDKPIGRLRQRIPEGAEVAKLVAALPASARLIYRALLQCGARPNELCRATFADWDRTKQRIVLQAHKTAEKTGEARTIQVGAKLRAILDEATAGRTEGPLFVRDRGQPWRVDALSRAFRLARVAAGVPPEVCLYCARHFHATAIAKHKGLRAAKDALGHKNIKTTDRYVVKDEEECRDNQDLVDGGLDPPAAEAA